MISPLTAFYGGWTEVPNYKNECPHIKRKYCGDESVDLCEINDKFCLLESGLECETWNEVQKEWEQEAAAAGSK